MEPRTLPEEFIAVPFKGVESLRAFLEEAGEFFPHEIITTSDQERMFRVNDDGVCVFMGPTVWHGTVADENAMLALNGTSARGCWPGDKCERADQSDAVYECIANNGASSADWKAVAQGASQLASNGRWEPVTNGDPEDTELVYDGAGDIVMGFVTD